MQRPRGARAKRRVDRRILPVLLPLLLLVLPRPGPVRASPPDVAAAPSAPVPPGLLLYSRDRGDEWRAEPGPCAGAVAPALARRDAVPLEHAHVEGDLLRLRICGASGEIGQLDAISLLAVDHDPGVRALPDGGGWFHALGMLTPPVRAQDFSGADALPAVSADDGRYWESPVRHRDPALESDLHDGVEVEFTRPLRTARAMLVVDAESTPWVGDVLRAAVSLHGFETQAWFDAVLADSARAHRVRGALAGGTSLRVWVWALDGWESQGAVADSGPGMRTRQAVALDLSRTIGGTIRVRLESVPGFWRIDRAAIDWAPAPPVLVQDVRPEIARDTRGRDVRGPLIAEDRTDFPLAPGDTVELLFRVPPASPGRARNYLARVTAWCRLDTPQTGQPERGPADALETGPDALAQFAVTRMNAASSSVEGARPGPAR